MKLHPNVNYYIGDVKKMLDTSSDSNLFPLNENIAIETKPDYRYRILNIEWVFDPKYKIKNAKKFLLDIAEFNNKNNPLFDENQFFETGFNEEIPTIDRKLNLQYPKMLKEPSYIENYNITLDLPPICDEILYPFEFLYLIQALVNNGGENFKLDFRNYNHFITLIETEHGYYHMVLDNPKKKINRKKL